MAISFSRPDPSSPAAVSTANFSTTRRGFEPDEVREFLRMVAAELARLQEREKFLERELRTAHRSAPSPAVALDEEVVTRMLGEEAARILSTAREAASQIKVRAEEGASRMLREATDEAQRLREEAEIEAARRRQDASSDADAEVQMAKQQGREMVNEARAYRERVLGELARRRELARQQIEQLVHGRDRLLQAFERARLAAVDVMSEMTPLGGPNEYVDLTPTTGPVPLMVPAADLRAERRQAAEADVAAAAAQAAEAVAEIEVAAAQVVATELLATDDQHAPAQAVFDREHEPDDTVVLLRDSAQASADGDRGDGADDGGRIAPVVALFAGEVELPAIDVEDDADVATDAGDSGAIDEADEATTDEATTDEATTDEATTDIATDDIASDQPAEAARPTVDDLFARLRAARADGVAERAQAGDRSHRAAEHADAEHADALAADADGHSAAAEALLVEVADVMDVVVVDIDVVEVVEMAVIGEAPAPDTASVFSPSPVAPLAAPATDDSAFGRRDAELTPLIVAGARKLKRVLADEQNDVLHILRRNEPVRSLDALLPAAAEQLGRYAAAIDDDLRHAALAGAASVDDGSAVDHSREINQRHALRPAVAALGSSIIDPLRERLQRAVGEADGDNGELANAVRAVYREWKTQRIDEHLDDVARLAFGRGALVALAPGTPVCWAVDPNGPACPDAEDNALAGVIGAGEPFPTDHTCAPAHDGCRCMLQRAPR